MQTNSIRLKVGLFLGAVGLATSAIAQNSHCQGGVGRNNPTTPSSAFVDQGDGTVTHSETGLQWSRCAIGQQFAGGDCDGRAQVFFWEEAADAVAQLNDRGGIGGHTDWRLPTLSELLTIVEECREAPAINPEIFPKTPWTGFWTVTMEEGTAGGDGSESNPQAWFVGFYKGLEYPYDIFSSYRVRPVRTAN